MRRTLVYFALSIVTSLVGAQNSEPGFIKVGDGGTTSVAMSPNGKYAVGQGVGIGDAPMYKSYLWDAENGQLTWMTELDENDFDKVGISQTLMMKKQLLAILKMRIIFCRT